MIADSNMDQELELSKNRADLMAAGLAGSQGQGIVAWVSRLVVVAGKLPPGGGQNYKLES